MNISCERRPLSPEASIFQKNLIHARPMKFLGARLFINLDKITGHSNICFATFICEILNTHSESLSFSTSEIHYHNTCAKLSFQLLLPLPPDEILATRISPVHTQLCYCFKIIAIYQGSLTNDYTWGHMYVRLSL